MSFIKTLIRVITLLSLLISTTHLYTMDQKIGSDDDEKYNEAEKLSTQQEEEIINFILLKAAADGNVETVKYLLQCGANVNFQQPDTIGTLFDTTTALIQAARKGHREIVETLLAAGARIDVQDNKGLTALLCAAMQGHLHVIETLFHHPEQAKYINQVEQNGCTALMRAANKGHTNIVNFLLKAHSLNSNQNPDVSLQNKVGNTALILALLKGNVDTTKLLLKASRGVTYKNKNGKIGLVIDIQNNNGDTALIIATRNLVSATRETATCMFNRETAIHMVGDLLNAGADVHIKNKRGNTALREASLYGYHEIVELLLDSKAHVDVRNFRNETPLMEAAYNNHAHVIDHLITAKADINAQDNMLKTALMWATEKNRVEAVRMLLEAKAQVDIQDVEGHTALMKATLKNHIEVAHLLLAAQDCVNIRNSKKENITLLMIASNSGHADIVEALLYAGAEVDANDDSENTSLMWTVLEENKKNNHENKEAYHKVARKLVLAGANPHTLCFRDMTPWEQASPEMERVITAAQREKQFSEQFSQWLTEIISNTKEQTLSTQEKHELVLPSTIIYLIEEYATAPFSPLDMAKKKQERAITLKLNARA